MKLKLSIKIAIYFLVGYNVAAVILFPWCNYVLDPTQRKTN